MEKLDPDISDKDHQDESVKRLKGIMGKNYYIADNFTTDKVKPVAVRGICRSHLEYMLRALNGTLV